MSSYKKQFEEANKRLTDDEVHLLEINEQMKKLQEEKERVEKQIESDKKNKVNKGLLYYSENMRSSLLDKAESLQYSKKTITRLRTYDSDQWNQDNVDIDTIADFESVEQHVRDNSPSWEKSPFAKLGKAVNRDR